MYVQDMGDVPYYQYILTTLKWVA